MFTRHIKFKGTYNFRDIGGYTANNQKHIKPGMIFRSGRLSRLTRKDLNHFCSLNIRQIIDLRGQQERDMEPTRLPTNHSTKCENICLHKSGLDIHQLKRRLLRGELREKDLKALMLEEYKRYVTDKQPEIIQIFNLLLNPDNYPVLIHCNGGKDRTGFVTALIHHALGVSQENIFQDFLLSQDALKAYIRKLAVYIRFASLFRASIQHLSPMLETNPEYLTAAFSTIKNVHGSMDSYLQAIGLNSTAKNQLESILCQ